MYISLMHLQRPGRTKMYCSFGSQAFLSSPLRGQGDKLLQVEWPQLVLCFPPPMLQLPLWFLRASQSRSALPVQSTAQCLAGQWSQLPSKSKRGLTPFCLSPEFHCAYFPMKLLHWLLTSVTWGHKADAGQITWQYHYGFWAAGNCSQLVKVLWAESTGMSSQNAFQDGAMLLHWKTALLQMSASCGQTAFLFLMGLYNFPTIFLSFSSPSSLLHQQAAMDPMLTYCFSACLLVTCPRLSKSLSKAKFGFHLP